MEIIDLDGQQVDILYNDQQKIEIENNDVNQHKIPEQKVNSISIFNHDTDIQQYPHKNMILKNQQKSTEVLLQCTPLSVDLTLQCKILDHNNNNQIEVNQIIASDKNSQKLAVYEQIDKKQIELFENPQQLEKKSAYQQYQNSYFTKQSNNKNEFYTQSDYEKLIAILGKQNDDDDKGIDFNKYSINKSIHRKPINYRQLNQIIKKLNIKKNNGGIFISYSNILVFFTCIIIFTVYLIISHYQRKIKSLKKKMANQIAENAFLQEFKRKNSTESSLTTSYKGKQQDRSQSLSPSISQQNITPNNKKLPSQGIKIKTPPSYNTDFRSDEIISNLQSNFQNLKGEGTPFFQSVNNICIQEYQSTTQKSDESKNLNENQNNFKNNQCNEIDLDNMNKNQLSQNDRHVHINKEQYNQISNDQMNQQNVSNESVHIDQHLKEIQQTLSLDITKNSSKNTKKNKSIKPLQEKIQKLQDLLLKKLDKTTNNESDDSIKGISDIIPPNLFQKLQDQLLKNSSLNKKSQEYQNLEQLQNLLIKKLTSQQIKPQDNKIQIKASENTQIIQSQISASNNISPAKHKNSNVLLEKLENFYHVQQDIFENGKFQKMFEDINLIGNGGFGHVYKAKYKIDKNIYAIKQILLVLGKDDQVQNHKAMKEVSMMTKLNHKNIIRYYSSWFEEPEIKQKMDFLEAKKWFRDGIIGYKRSKQSLKSIQDDSSNIDSNDQTERIQQLQQDLNIEFQHSQQQSDEQTSQYSSSEESQNLTDNTQNEIIHSLYNLIQHEEDIPVSLHIQMHYCKHMNLKDFIDKRKQIDTNLNFNIFRQILCGMEYIHEQRIVHRDIKPQNIFLDENDQIYIGDFGLSTFSQCNEMMNQSLQKKECQNSCNSMTKNIGTPLYIAPEQEYSSSYNNKVDIYALGLILFELFQNMSTTHERFSMIKDLKQKGLFPKIFKEKYPFIKNIIDVMIDPDPEKRPSIKQIMNNQNYIIWSQIQQA